MARWLLRAAYEGSVLAALCCTAGPGAAALPGRRMLFLTIVGAGAFRNNVTWACDAILATRPLLLGSGLDVRVVDHAGEHAAVLSALARDMAAAD